MQQERDGVVRWSAWLGTMKRKYKIKLIARGGWEYTDEISAMTWAEACKIARAQAKKILAMAKPKPIKLRIGMVEEMNWC